VVWVSVIFLVPQAAAKISITLNALIRSVFIDWD